MGALSTSATRAYFSDTETSNNNTFAAGSLDLTVNGNNGTNTVGFNVTGMRPGNQPHGSFTLANIGSIAGYLNMSNIQVTNAENGCLQPESDAGDVTCDNPGDGQGELQNVINARIWVDRNGDGWMSAGEPVLYNGLLGSIPDHLTFNEPLSAGASTKIGVLIDWWSTPSDNQAMSDSAVLNMSFSLNQNTL